MKKLAIVGSYPETRGQAPWDDLGYEIWVFNEAAQQEWCERWNAVIQLHQEAVYTSPNNYVNKGHWAWLQEDHGDGKVIWMQEADERVPNAKRYPLDEIADLVPGAGNRWFESSAAYALALALYLGYEEVALFGLDMHSNTEYGYQLRNYQYWVGVLTGAGVRVDNQCNFAYFAGKLYGYEGEVQIARERFAERAVELDGLWQAAEVELQKAKKHVEWLIEANKYAKLPDAAADYQMKALAAGELAGALAEAQKYAGREDPITRQEFETRHATAQQEGEGFRAKMYFAAGQSDYVWNAWKVLQNREAAKQLLMFVGQQGQHAYDTGARLGIWRENFTYMTEIDDLITAAGGMRSVKALGRLEGI
jgi:hypothetical protein